MSSFYDAGSSTGNYDSYGRYSASHRQPPKTNNNQTSAKNNQKSRKTDSFMPQSQTSKQSKKDIDAELNYYETKLGYGKSNQDKISKIAIALKDTSSAPVVPVVSYKYGEKVDTSGIEFVGSNENTNTNTTSQTQENNNECSFYQRAWIGSKAKEESSNTENNSTKETNKTTYDNNESSWFGDAWRGDKAKEESSNTQNNSTKEANETTQEKPKEESSKKVDSYNVDSPTNKTWIMPPVRGRGRR